MSSQDSQEVTVFASAARGLGANNSDDISAAVSRFRQYRGVRLFLDVTAVSGTNPTLNVKIQVKDPLAGNYHDIVGAAFAEETAAANAFLTIYPGLTAVADLVVTEVISGIWRAVATVGGTATPTVTFTLAAVYVP